LPTVEGAYPGTSRLTKSGRRTGHGKRRSIASHLPVAHSHLEDQSGDLAARAGNENYIVNYGDRYRNGETISTAFVESTVNEVISKRFVKKQQMRWTKEGART
jgi:hypothetical protein